MITAPQRLQNDIEALKKMFDDFDFDLRVASPGIIQSFDPITQLASITIAIKENRVINGKIESTQIADIVDVPIVTLRAGGFFVAPPVKEGDECLVIFSDTCIDAWWQSGGIRNAMSVRRHDLSDGFAILAPWNTTRCISNYPTESMQIRNEADTVKIELTHDTITINASSDVTINAGSDVTINATSHASINADMAKITAPTVVIDGDTTITETLSVLNDDVDGGASTLNGGVIIRDGAAVYGGLIVDGVVFASHVHTGVEPGGGTTGPVMTGRKQK